MPVWAEFAGMAARPLVVLVHGSMDRSAGLLRLSRRLDADFHVLRYDRRGYGRSAPLGGPFTVDRHVDDLADLLDAEAPGHRAALVFGHSFGGHVALGLAERYPHLIAAAAVYETPMAWQPWWPGDTAGGRAIGTDPAEAGEAFMRRLVGDDKWDRLPSATKTARRAEGTALLGELADLRTGQPWAGDRIAVPVLAMAGERARPHHARGMEWLAEELDDCSTAVVAGAGHVGPNTHADDVSDALRTFHATSTG